MKNLQADVFQESVSIVGNEDTLLDSAGQKVTNQQNPNHDVCHLTFAATMETMTYTYSIDKLNFDREMAEHARNLALMHDITHPDNILTLRKLIRIAQRNPQSEADDILSIHLSEERIDVPDTVREEMNREGMMQPVTLMCEETSEQQYLVYNTSCSNPAFMEKLIDSNMTTFFDSGTNTHITNRCKGEHIVSYSKFESDHVPTYVRMGGGERHKALGTVTLMIN